MADYNIPAKATFAFGHWAYGSDKSEAFKIFLISITYVSFLMWFTHVDIIHNWVSEGLKENQTIIDCLIEKHARFLTLFTNWGLLFMLYLDLWIANKTNHNKASVALNIFGVLAVLLAYGFAAGVVIDKDAAKILGVLSNPNLSICALVVFIAILCYLKFISLKSEDK